MVIAVFVGESKRFPNKHFVELKDGYRLIDLVLDSLRGTGFEVIVYSKVVFDCPVPLLKDRELWILPSLISLLEVLSNEGIERVLAVGGDMPLVSRKAVDLLASSLSSRDLALVPRWSNGYLEPLFAIYSCEFAVYLKGALNRGIKSLNLAIKGSPGVSFVSAEAFPPNTFFNVNEPKDLEIFRELIKGNVDL